MCLQIFNERPLGRVCISHSVFNKSFSPYFSKINAKVVEPLLRLQLLDLVQHEVLLVWPVGGGATDVMEEWEGRGVEDE